MNGVLLHLADGAAALADELARQLSGTRADPFRDDVVCVPQPSVQRWLAQRLARRLGIPGEGICAGVTFLSPNGLRRRLDPAHADDPWRPQRLTWTLRRVLAEHRDDPALAQLRRHLSASRDQHTTLRRLAGVFDRYADWRSPMLSSWAQCNDVDDAGEPLGFDAWQPQLWRQAVAALGRGPLADRQQLLERVRTDPGGLDLPAELSVFLPGALPPFTQELLLALGEHRVVRVYLTEPQPAGVAPHPLSLRLGRRSANANRQLRAAATDQVRVSSAPRPASLLGAVQTVVSAPGSVIGGQTADSSLQVHACHGLDRQVEVLRDVLTGLFADDPTLEPRDVVIGCADLAAAAPLVSAAFRLPASVPHRHPGNDLRVQVAALSAADSNPLIGILLRVLALLTGRAEAAEVLELCAEPAVADRFGFGGDDADRLAELVQRAGVRWGLSARHRTRFGLGALPHNTWAAGLRRLLLGIALSEDGLATAGTTLPVDDVDSSDVPLIGGLAELIARLSRLAEEFETPATPADWMERLRRCLDATTLLRGEDAWQRTHAFAGLAAIAGRAPGSGPLDLADVIAAVEEEFAETPARSSFGNGSLIVCGLAALGAVPHRVICLLGLDEGSYPRRPFRDGDDLMARAPRPGDPDPSADDRQLLLDAVLAAEQHLVICYQGRNPTTNEPVPAPAPLQDLLEVAHDLTAGDPVVVEHPLQPFSPRYFEGTPRSFDPAGLQGARAVSGPRPALPEVRAIGPATPPSEVSLTDLLAFAKHPARHFLKARCGLSSGDWGPEPDAIPVELDSLQSWQVGHRILALARAGHTLEAAARAEWLRGSVPPGVLGERLLEVVCDDVGSVLRRLPAEAGAPRVPHDLTLDLGGVRLTGRVITQGELVLAAEYSRLAPKHRLDAWLRLALLCAADPGGWRALVVARGQHTRLKGPDPDVARQVLADWLSLYRRGLDAPLPLPPRVAENIASLRAAGGDPFDPENRTLERAWNFDADDVWRRFFPDLQSLLREQAEPLARLAWDPLLAHEEAR